MLLEYPALSLSIGVQDILSILEDTLIGKWLPAYKPRAKIKEVSHPKFYWFDTGVLQATASGFRERMPQDWYGHAFETWVFQELSAYIHYYNKGGNLSY